MNRFVVIMTVDREAFGYFSTIGLIETEYPQISTFLNPTWPLPMLVEKVRKAKARTLGYKERHTEEMASRDRKLMCDWTARDYQASLAALEKEKLREWAIVELQGQTLATI